MFDAKFKKKGAIISIIPIYFIASLFVPAMGLFTYSLNKSSSFISTGALMMIHKFKNDPLGGGLRKFLVEGIKGSTLIELLWYSMILQFITAVVFIIGAAIFWLSKNSKKSGFNALSVSGYLYIGAAVCQLFVVLIAKLTVPKNVNFALNFNIPFVVITVILSVLFIVVSCSMRKNFKEPKLRK